MASRGWQMILICHHSHPSNPSTTHFASPYTALILRERREDRIFQDLLRLCHGLEDRLADASPEDLETIADLVSCFIHHPLLLDGISWPRSKRGPMLLVPMIPRGLKVSL
jgi:hypothetical protein